MGTVVPARVRTRRTAGGMLVTLGPILGDSDAPLLRAALLRSHNAVSVDAGWVGGISDACLGTLLGAAGRCWEAGVPFHYTRVSAPLFQRVDALGLSSFFTTV